VRQMEDWFTSEDLHREDEATPITMNVAQLGDVENIVRRAMNPYADEQKRIRAELHILRLAVEALTHQIVVRNSNARAVELVETLRSLVRPTRP
jgi:hypothetical protein